MHNSIRFWPSWLFIITQCMLHTGFLKHIMLWKKQKNKESFIFYIQERLEAVIVCILLFFVTDAHNDVSSFRFFSGGRWKICVLLKKRDTYVHILKYFFEVQLNFPFSLDFRPCGHCWSIRERDYVMDCLQILSTGYQDSRSLKPYASIYLWKIVTIIKKDC